MNHFHSLDTDSLQECFWMEKVWHLETYQNLSEFPRGTPRLSKATK